MNEDIGRCPWCGYIPEIGIDGSWRTVTCINQFCAVKPYHQTMSMKSLISEWNDRKPKAKRKPHAP